MSQPTVLRGPSCFMHHCQVESVQTLHMGHYHRESMTSYHDKPEDYCSCSKLSKVMHCQAVELLREVASVEPAVYEQQQQADAAGVRSVAGFIVELADR